MPVTPVVVTPGLGGHHSQTDSPDPHSSSSSATTAASNGGGGGGGGGEGAAQIREVWASNLEEEFKELRNIVKKYPYVAMDTEFPGVVARPLGEFKSREDYQYQLLRCNVDLLRLIQVGLSFYDENGQTPPDISTWQFNFKFNLHEDMFAQDSVDLLQKSGIQFRRLTDDGIVCADFAELLMTSGLVLNDKVTWLSFHSGYDFGYLMKLLTNTKLSEDQNEFTQLLNLFFPHIYDIKSVMRYLSVERNHHDMTGGLQEIADNLQVERIGRSHQAGSDSLLTGFTFYKIKQKYFGNDWKGMGQFEQQLFGITTASNLSGDIVGVSSKESAITLVEGGSNGGGSGGSRGGGRGGSSGPGGSSGTTGGIITQEGVVRNIPPGLSSSVTATSSSSSTSATVRRRGDSTAADHQPRSSSSSTTTAVMKQGSSTTAAAAAGSTSNNNNNKNSGGPRIADGSSGGSSSSSSQEEEEEEDSSSSSSSSSSTAPSSSASIH